MFKLKKKVTPNQQIQKMETALRTMRVISDFFGPTTEVREGESPEELIARCLGITLPAYKETIRLFQSIVAGRVIPKVEGR